jgi:hypothetical protein
MSGKAGTEFDMYGEHAPMDSHCSRQGSPEKPKNLTNRQRRFVHFYLQCWNASEAAQRAGYGRDRASSATLAWRLLRKVEISRAISTFLNTAAMGAAEVLARLADIARGDMGDFIDCEDGKVILNLEKASRRNVLHLIKRIRVRDVCNFELELHSSQTALGLLLRYHAGTQRVPPLERQDKVGQIRYVMTDEAAQPSGPSGLPVDEQLARLVAQAQAGLSAWEAEHSQQQKLRENCVPDRRAHTGSVTGAGAAALVESAKGM